jgi:hypothetical protein
MSKMGGFDFEKCVFNAKLITSRVEDINKVYLLVINKPNQGEDMLNFLNKMAVIGYNTVGKVRELVEKPLEDGDTAIKIGNTIYGVDKSFAWMKDLLNVMNMVSLIVMIAVGAAGTLYSIVLGVNLARAEDAEKREAAKKRLIWAIVGLGSIVVLALLIFLLLPTIIEQVLKGADNVYIVKG